MVIVSPLSLFFALLSPLKFAVRRSSDQAIRPLISSSLNMKNIIVVGSANVDLSVYAPSLPVKGETILGDEFSTSLGGKGANQAIAAARLGTSKSESMKSVHMICKVGNDSYGRSLIRNFDQAGVRYSANDIVTDYKQTGIAAISVDSEGENTIIVVPGSNHDLTADHVQNQILEMFKDHGSGSIVMTQLEINHDAALMAMQMGRQGGALTILNPAPAQKSLHEDFFNCVDIIIPNEIEIRLLIPDQEGKSIEELAKKLLEKGIRKAVIVTLGAKGAMVVERKHDSDEVDITMVSAPAGMQKCADPVVDTVGAGDSFCGSLAVYLASGLGTTNAAIKACGVAGISVRKKGAQGSYPQGHELPDCLQLEYDSTIGNNSQTQKKVLTFVTGNKKKLEEVQAILSTEETELAFGITNRKIDLPELQGEDPVEVAIEKCKLAAEEVQGPVFTEDTSLCFNALNGMPGLYIKWFLQKCGHVGLNSMLDGFDDRSAYAQTIVAFTMGVGEEIHVFDGRTDGEIVEARGPLDFGW
jgi:ribokinase/non-canonical purine NTP pyrophosphatase (RdgB/HAM1 family)